MPWRPERYLQQVTVGSWGARFDHHAAATMTPPVSALAGTARWEAQIQAAVTKIVTAILAEHRDTGSIGATMTPTVGSAGNVIMGEVAARLAPHVAATTGLKIDEIGTITAALTKTITALAGLEGGIGAITAALHKALTSESGNVITGNHYTDNFDRADNASSLGANWTNRTGTMGITSTDYAYGSSHNGGPITNGASYNSTMATDYHKVQCTMVTAGRAGMLFLASGTDKQCLLSFALGIAQEFAIYTSTTWARTTSRASATTYPTAGDTVSIERLSGTSFVGRINGTQIVVWDDTGNYMPKDASHRMVGIGGVNTSGTAQQLDDWDAQG